MLLIYYFSDGNTKILLISQKTQNRPITKNMKAALQPSEQYLKKYKSIKQSLELPLKLNLYFNFLQATLENSQPQKPSHSSHGFSSLFYPIFSQLSKQEKSFYLFCNIEFVKLQFDKIQTVGQGRTERADRAEGGSDFRATGQISQSVFGVTYWSKVEVSFSYQSRKIKIGTKKRTYEADLRLYLIRKSKKYENTLVLDAISEVVSVDDRKISMFFKSTIFQQIYLQLFKCILAFRNQELYKIALQDYKQSQSMNTSEISYIGHNSRSLNFLTSKNVNQFLNFKDTVLKKLLKADFKFEKIFTVEACKIEKDKNHMGSEHSLYKLETNFQCNVESLKKQFLQKYKAQNFKYLMQSQQLEKCSNKYSAVYEKLLFRSSYSEFKSIEQIVIEEVNLKEGTCQNEELVFQKGVKGIKLNSFIDFLMVKVKGLGTQDKSKLIVVGSFGKNCNNVSERYHKKKETIETEETQEIIIKFLLQFSDMIFRKENQLENMQKILESIRGKSQLEEDQAQGEGEEQNQFRTVIGNFKNDDKDELVLNVDGQFDGNQIEQTNLSSDVQPYQDPQSNPQQKILTHLNHSYQLQPTLSLFKQNNEHKKLQPTHFIFQQWCRRPKGGIVCKDQTAINEQKKLANFMLRTLGKRIFQQKGINLSLPVTIFKPESHLHSVARNLSFAPILLQKASKLPAAQRMKLAMLYALSVTVSSISVNKPFNPILGETLQMWIDGCPVYLEQISHHPPIVAYYMVGRGYKIYGSIGPKVSFGFNSITGYADQPNFVEFDDGDRIELNFGKMVINGIIIGERTFNFTDKMYAIDPKNRLFCQLKFGQEKASLFSKSSEPEDYFHGKIVKTNNEFIDNFYSNSAVTYPVKEEIESEISKFQGIWNGKIYIDEQQYIDFAVVNGCAVEEEKYPLPSNSSYRRDLQYLKEGDVNSAQQQKQILQNIQRRDQNLRKNHKNK